MTNTSDDWRRPLMAELAQPETRIESLPRWHPRRWLLSFRLRRLSRQFDQGWQ
ncbi:MAG: hypothetical protein R3C39_10595 [Dehalococcoidia bacterium]